jgi:hypothetical protein
LIVFFTTILLDAFEGPLLRLYEGYWLFWTGLPGRRKRTLEDKLERRRELRARVATNRATLAEKAELSRIDTELAHRPRDPERSMPTRLGDILRTGEDYARERYGLDPIVLWPRLFPHLGETLREALGARISDERVNNSRSPSVLPPPPRSRTGIHGSSTRLNIVVSSVAKYP